MGFLERWKCSSQQLRLESTAFLKHAQYVVWSAHGSACVRCCCCCCCCFCSRARGVVQQYAWWWWWCSAKHVWCAGRQKVAHLIFIEKDSCFGEFWRQTPAALLTGVYTAAPKFLTLLSHLRRCPCHPSWPKTLHRDYNNPLDGLDVQRKNRCIPRFVWDICGENHYPIQGANLRYNDVNPAYWLDLLRVERHQAISMSKSKCARSSHAGA